MAVRLRTRQRRPIYYLRAVWKEAREPRMRLNRLWCALRFQHGAAMLVIGPNDLYLRCPDCGWRSQGWPLKGSHAPQEKVPEDDGIRNTLGFDRLL